MKVNDEKQYITTTKGIQLELLHYDGQTPETSTWVTVINEQGNKETFKTRYGKMMENYKRIERSGLSELMRVHTFDSYKTDYEFQKIIKARALEYLKEKIGWFSVLGKSGSGKTKICTALAIQLMKQGMTLEYMLWMEEINYLKYNMKDSDKILRKYTQTDVLYIDDFLKTRGDTEPTDIELELAFAILDARYRKNKLTIISSEKGIAQIKKYDHAVYRRIVEKSGENEKYLCRIGNDEAKDMSLKYKRSE